MKKTTAQELRQIKPQRKLQDRRQAGGEDIKRIRVRIEPDLFDKVDAFAKRHSLKRSEMVAKASRPPPRGAAPRRLGAGWTPPPTAPIMYLL